MVSNEYGIEINNMICKEYALQITYAIHVCDPPGVRDCNDNTPGKSALIAASNNFHNTNPHGESRGSNLN